MKKGMIQRAKKSLLGRFVCRLAGDQKGAVMMEYVIVAVLIAAAAVVAVAYFGRTITKQFGVAAHATAGQGDAASGMQAGVKAQAKAAEDDGKIHLDKFSDQAEK